MVSWRSCITWRCFPTLNRPVKSIWGGLGPSRTKTAVESTFHRCACVTRKNKNESTRRSSNKRNKNCTVIINTVRKCLSDCFKYLLKCGKQILKFTWKTLESNWWNSKWRWNFTRVCTISLSFEIYFPEFPWEIVFGGYYRQLPRQLYLYLEIVGRSHASCINLQLTPAI